jgi:hypothetical protein
MNRLRLALLVSGLITPFVVGLINSNAGTIDSLQRDKEGHSVIPTLKDPTRFHLTEQSSARDLSLLPVLWYQTAGVISHQASEPST